MKTASVNKHDLMQHAQQDMQKWISDLDLTDRQKLALTCRILFDHGHDAGLAGQITCRSENKETFITQRFGLGFDEITASNLLSVHLALHSSLNQVKTQSVMTFIPVLIFALFQVTLGRTVLHA